MADIAKGVRSSITIEVKPTVTLESACACVMMLNMFLEDNDEYRLELAENDTHDGVKWRLTDKPVAPATGGIVTFSPFNDSSHLADEERKSIVEQIAERLGLTVSQINSVDPDGRMWMQFKEMLASGEITLPDTRGKYDEPSDWPSPPNIE